MVLHTTTTDSCNKVISKYSNIAKWFPNSPDSDRPQSTENEHMEGMGDTLIDNEFEGHEYSDFSIGIRDAEKTKPTMESKLQEIAISEPFAKQLKLIVWEFTTFFLSKRMKVDIKCKHRKINK